MSRHLLFSIGIITTNMPFGKDVICDELRILIREGGKICQWSEGFTVSKRGRPRFCAEFAVSRVAGIPVRLLLHAVACSNLCPAIRNFRVMRVGRCPMSQLWIRYAVGSTRSGIFHPSPDRGRALYPGKNFMAGNAGSFRIRASGAAAGDCSSATIPRAASAGRGKGGRPTPPQAPAG